VFHGLLRNAWQRRFEASLLPQPEIYKRHAFVIKDNNDRLIVLSDFWFYVSWGACAAGECEKHLASIAAGFS